MKNNKNNKKLAKDASSTGNLDEGMNETTRLPYSDSISTASNKKDSRNKK